MNASEPFLHIQSDSVFPAYSLIEAVIENCLGAIGFTLMCIRLSSNGFFPDTKESHMHSSESSNAEIGFRDQEKPGEGTRHKRHGTSKAQAVKRLRRSKQQRLKTIPCW